MYKIVVWVTSATGAALGIFSSVMDSLGLMIVMGLIGAAFGCLVGNGVTLLVKSRQKKSNWNMQENKGEMEDIRRDHRGVGSDEKSSEFPIPTNSDPVTKSITGWRDAADVARSRDIF
jgi:hypothetical protein